MWLIFYFFDSSGCSWFFFQRNGIQQIVENVKLTPMACSFSARREIVTLDAGLFSFAWKSAWLVFFNALGILRFHTTSVSNAVSVVKPMHSHLWDQQFCSLSLSWHPMASVFKSEQLILTALNLEDRKIRLIRLPAMSYLAGKFMPLLLSSVALGFYIGLCQWNSRGDRFSAKILWIVIYSVSAISSYPTCYITYQVVYDLKNRRKIHIALPTSVCHVFFFGMKCLHNRLEMRTTRGADRFPGH